MRKASCARPTSTSGRGFRASIDGDAADRSEHRRHGRSPASAERHRGSDAGLQLRLSRQRRRMPGSAGYVDRWRRQAAAASRAGTRTDGPRRNTSADRAQPARRSPTKSWPRSTARCPMRRPMNWRGVIGLARIASQNFPLIGATIGLFRITDRRSVETVSRELAADASVRSVQPNFRYLLQDQKAALTEGDPAQYALAKLRLPQAHTLAHGANVTIAVIDSGIDVKHPELAERDRRQLRCARQQGRSACPRHRHCRRDRGACAADGKRAGGAGSWRSAPSASRRMARKARRS